MGPLLERLLATARGKDNPSFNPPQSANGGSAPVGFTNAQIDLLAQRIAYWTRRKTSWEEIRGNLFVQDSLHPLTPATPTNILLGDPRRVGLILAVTVGTAANITLRSSSVANTGFQVTTNSPFLDFTYRRHATLASQEWWGFAGGACTILAIEMIALRLS